MSYTPGQVSEYLSIPPSTLRHWAKVYSSHLSQSAQGRRRVYTDGDLEILQKVKGLSNKGKLVSDIKQALGEVVVIDEQEVIPESSIALIPAIQERLDNLATREDIEAINAKLDRLLEERKKTFWDRLRGR